MPDRNTLTRRALLRNGAAAFGAAALAAGPRHAAAAEKSPYGPFKMGIQSYSLRGYQPVDAALEQTKKLGLHYWEAYSAHVPLTTDPAKVAEILGKMRSADVRLLAHGVNRFGADRDANRKVFEGAKALGIQTLSADPGPESLDQLEALVEEFGINIAIHNHGPGHRYNTLQDVLNAVQGRHKRIGASVDTGHFLRSRENPVRVIEALGERVYSVHLKDVKDATKFTILGEGDLDVAGVLKALRAAKFDQVLAIEYEENPKDPIADIQQCLAVVRSAVDRL